MICPVCRSDVPDTFQFCDQCGSRMRQPTLVTPSGRRFPVSKPEMVIGRFDPSTAQAPDVDLSADDPKRTVSRRHARLIERDGSYLLQIEPTARNGGELAGQRLQPGVVVPIRPGERFLLGQVDLVLEM